MKLILACDPNGGIGYNNTLPWPHLDGDLARFKSLTAGQIVIMGKRTWDSLPIKPLPNRLNIVVTSGRIMNPSVLVTSSLNVLDHFNDSWLIGGAKLIDSCWNRITEIHLSRTFTEYRCDTFIDLVKLDSFKQRSVQTLSDHNYEIWNKI